MTLQVRHCATAEEVLRMAGSVLAADEGASTTLYAILGRLEVEPDLTAVFAVVQRDGQVAGCVAGTPATRLAVSRLDDEAAAAVAAEVARVAPDVGAVVAPVPTADVLAAGISRATGRSPYVAMAQRHFCAEAVTAPPDVPGTLRPTGEDDRSLLEAWVGAFITEALHDDPTRAAASVERWLAQANDDGRLMLWEAEGAPVSMAGFLGPTPTGITILSVYTPPEHRGHGYASACVATLTQYLLERGRRRVFLSTDLANPTSNRIYQRIGYRPLGDATMYRFG